MSLAETVYGRMGAAMKAGLGFDMDSWRIGEAHGSAGVPWRCPEGRDVLSYAAGYVEGERYRPRCGGQRAQPQQAAE